MPYPIDLPAGGTQWGVKHSQGIRWEYSEQSARDYIIHALPGDARVHAKGKYRLVKRELGPIVEVWNPYEQTSPDACSNGETDG